MRALPYAGRHDLVFGTDTGRLFTLMDRRMSMRCGAAFCPAVGEDDWLGHLRPRACESSKGSDYCKHIVPAMADVDGDGFTDLLSVRVPVNDAAMAEMIGHSTPPHSGFTALPEFLRKSGSPWPPQFTLCVPRCVDISRRRTAASCTDAPSTKRGVEPFRTPNTGARRTAVAGTNTLRTP